MENVSIQYFEQVRRACGQLHNFCSELDYDGRTLAKAREILGLSPGSETGYLELAVIDLLRCFKKMYRSFPYGRKELLAPILLLTAKGFEYPLINTFYETGVKHLEEVWNSKSMDSITNSGFDLITPLILKDFPDINKKYCILFFRLCMVTMTADDVVEKEEKKMLLSLFDAVDRPEEFSPVISNMEDDGIDDEAGAKDDPESIESILGELEDLVGLSGVKNEIRALASFAKVSKMRADRGLKTTPMSLHCIFTGNPGTGKTTVARILGRIYHSLGLVSKQVFVEADRSSLVASYLGQTAHKTNELIDSALGGMLFIDEAYSLFEGEQDLFGKEAISTLLKRMEDDRDRLVVIIAGYQDKMDEFLNTNPGLKSRFGRTLLFENYSEDELVEIFMKSIRSFDYKITPGAVEAVRKAIAGKLATADERFGNAREARNLFEKVIQAQAYRIANMPVINDDMLETIEESDVENIR